MSALQPPQFITQHINSNLPSVTASALASGCTLALLRCGQVLLILLWEQEVRGGKTSLVLVGVSKTRISTPIFQICWLV